MADLHAAVARCLDAHTSLIEAIAAIPAPSFGEAERGEFILARFREVGLTDTEMDGAGNVRGTFPVAAGPGLAVVAAHMDTVYPRNAHQPPRRDGSRLTGSSVRDNSASVAALITLARAMREASVVPPCRLEFASDTGEEGLGDLRGIRHRLRPEESRPDVVLLVDGPLGQIVHQGIAVRRFSVRFETDGGHSWGDFGAPSAIHQLAAAIDALARMSLPTDPKTTLNVGVISGGTSVNAIAASAEMQVDFRSVEPARVDALAAQLERLVRGQATGGVRASVTVIGDRPGGRLASDHPLVEAMRAVHRAHGFEARLSASSTDANIPLSLGIPAVAIGIAGGGYVHSPREWLDLTSVPGGVHLLADAVLGAADVAARLAPSSPEGRKSDPGDRN